MQGYLSGAVRSIDKIVFKAEKTPDIVTISGEDGRAFDRNNIFVQCPISLGITETLMV